MNIYSKYDKPTAEMLIKLLEEAYGDQLVIDKILNEVSEEIIEDYIKLLNTLQKKGKINLEEKIDLMNHPEVYQIIKKAENQVWEKIMHQAWIWMMASTEESMKRTYRETMVLTYELFMPSIPQAKNLLELVPVQITDTYLTNRVLPIPWCQDGKVYSQRLYGHVANFQAKLNFVLEEGINRGKGLDWMIQAWRKLTGSTAYDAARLLKTETVAMWSEATKEAYLNMGIEYIEIVGDAACGEICTDYVGEVLPLAEAELGIELPPYHPNCACSYIAFEEEQEES